MYFCYCNGATPFLSKNRFIGNKASTFNGQIGASFYHYLLHNSLIAPVLSACCYLTLSQVSYSATTAGSSECSAAKSPSAFRPHQRTPLLPCRPCCSCWNVHQANMSPLRRVQPEDQAEGAGWRQHGARGMREADQLQELLLGLRHRGVLQALVRPYL